VQLYRPFDQIFDNYNPYKIGQTKEDYYIHEKSGWTDELIKKFRKNVRSQNICIRQEIPFYSPDYEAKKFDKEFMRNTKFLKTKEEKIKFLINNGIRFRFP